MTIVASEAITNQLLAIAISTDVGKAILGAFIEGAITNHEGEKKVTTNITDGKLTITFSIPEEANDL